MQSRNDAGSKVILIVEDQAMMSGAIKKFLKQTFPAWIVLQANNGEEAVTMCTAHRPDLILMDICLPDTDGLTVCQHLKKLNHELKIIFVSYLNSQSFVSGAKSVGGAAYVAKDKLFSELIPTINRILESNR